MQAPGSVDRPPVSHAAPSDARKTMTGAISSGLPNLAPSGVADAPAFPASLPTNPLFLLPSLSTGPGATTLTRMFRGPSLLGQCHREGVHRTLGRRIERRVRRGILTRDRADIDDAASTCREMLQSFLDSEDLSSKRNDPFNRVLCVHYHRSRESS